MIAPMIHLPQPSFRARVPDRGPAMEWSVVATTQGDGYTKACRFLGREELRRYPFLNPD